MIDQVASSLPSKDNRFFQSILIFFALLVSASLLLTIFSLQYYTYLPTSDTWVYSEFLANAANGQLDMVSLFSRHNDAHAIVLPKLIYFLDIYLTQGSGLFVTLCSLLFMLGTAILFFAVILSITTYSLTQRLILALLSTLLLTSAIQVESLLNPANLQWSLLNFFATLSAFFCARYLTATSNKRRQLVYLAFAMIGVALTSASILLIAIPVAIVFISQQFGARRTMQWFIKTTLITLAILVGWEIFRTLFFPTAAPLAFQILQSLFPNNFTVETLAAITEYFAAQPLMAYGQWLGNLLRFLALFFVPLMDRMNYPWLLLLCSAWLFYFFGKLLLNTLRSDQQARRHSWQSLFFVTLLLFTIFSALVIGFVRSPLPYAYTFRFANLGLLFAAALFPLLWLCFAQRAFYRFFIMASFITYSGLLAWLSVQESGAFGHGRNHIRLTQVAYSLDIKAPEVVVAMPGTAWQETAFARVEERKRLLQEHRIGIYSDPVYQQVGKTFDTSTTPHMVDCNYKVQKIRRLLPKQASYKLSGLTTTSQGKAVDQVIFTTPDNIVRGYGISQLPSKQLTKILSEPYGWSGFINLGDSIPADRETPVLIYGWADKILCRPKQIQLPMYQQRELNKKQRR